MQIDDDGNEVEVTHEPTIGDDLATAWDEGLSLEEAHDAENSEESEDAISEEVEAASGGQEGSTDGAPSDTEDSPDLQAGKEPEVEAEGSVGDPPVGLPPEAREAWKDTPEPVRQALVERERQFAVGIQRYAENSKRAEAMDRSLAPFQQFFAANGNQPAQTISNVLTTASVLQMGTPQQKAQMTKDLIEQFGVDIPTLDSILSGQEVPQEQKVQSTVQQAVQQAVAPYQQMMERVQAAQRQQVQQVQQGVSTELEQFASAPENEFYHDVKMTMADLLEMSANRGQELSLKDAYEQACQIDPKVRGVLASRKQQESLQSKRNLASSVTGSPGGDSAPAVPQSMREEIEQSWNAALRR